MLVNKGCWSHFLECVRTERYRLTVNIWLSLMQGHKNKYFSTVKQRPINCPLMQFTKYFQNLRAQHVALRHPLSWLYLSLGQGQHDVAQLSSGHAAGSQLGGRGFGARHWSGGGREVSNAVDRHVVFGDEGRDLKLIRADDGVQILDPGDTVHFLFDCGGHECGEPPGHHLCPERRVHNIARLQIFLIFIRKNVVDFSQPGIRRIVRTSSQRVEVQQDVVSLD